MLRKIAIDRTTKEMMKGNLSEKALAQLKQQNVFRPLDRYINGLNKGTSNILKRYGFSLREANSSLLALQSGGYYTSPADNAVYHLNPKNPSHRLVSPVLPKMGPQREVDLADALAKRHEAYEIIEGHRNAADILKKKFPHLGKTRREILNVKYEPTDPPILKALKKQRAELLKQQLAQPETVKANLINRNDGGISVERLKVLRKQIEMHNIKAPDNRYRPIAGRHYSLGVLGREANDIARIPYKEKEHLMKLRTKTGERGLLKEITGKDLYTRGTDPKSYRKLIKAKPLTSDNPFFPKYYMMNGPKQSHPILNRYLKGLDGLLQKFLKRR